MIAAPHPQANYRGPSVARLTSALPDDARAVIEREGRSVTQSGRRRAGSWRLRFERRHRYGVDPLTGWTSGTDPLTQIELRFPDAASAIRYAERHDLPYELREDPPAPIKIGGRKKHQPQGPMQLCCWPTGPHPLCCGQYPALKEAC